MPLRNRFSSLKIIASTGSINEICPFPLLEQRIFGLHQDCVKLDPFATSTVSKN